jgi:hypothetical protein
MVVSEYLCDAHCREGPGEWATPELAPGNEMLRVRRVEINSAGQRADGLLAGIVVLTTYSSADRRQPGLYRIGNASIARLRR